MNIFSLIKFHNKILHNSFYIINLSPLFIAINKKDMEIIDTLINNKNIDINFLNICINRNLYDFN